MGSDDKEPSVRLRDVQVVFADKTALSLDDLVVAQGERLGVIGPNGAGKSTLLRVVALLQQPQHGRVELLGTPVWPEPPGLYLRRRIAVVFQKPLLLDMSVFNNVAVGLRARGLPRKEIAQRVEHWLRRLHVWDLRERGVHGLSGGESQRVSLARAFAVEPEVMLLDEPFSSLDLPTRQQLLTEVEQVLEATGTTTILVSHDFYEVARLCHHALALFGGKPVFRGTPDELLRQTDRRGLQEFLAPWKELSAWSARATRSRQAGNDGQDGAPA